MPLVALVLALPALANEGAAPESTALETTELDATELEALLLQGVLPPELFWELFRVRAQGAPQPSAGPPPEHEPSPGPPADAPANGEPPRKAAENDDGPGNSENTPAANRRTYASASEPEQTSTPETTSDETAPRRFRRRSIGSADLSEPVREETAPPPASDEPPRPRETREPAAGRVRTGGDRTAADGSLGRVEAVQAAGSERATRRRDAARARTPERALDAAASRPTEAPASTEPAEAKPEQPLPVRIVPRPLRRIVEVVPGEIWAALGALGLLALALAISSWLTARRARLLRRQREALLEEVGLLQAALLPAVPEHLPASVAYRPTEGPAAGGDFYEAFALSDGRTGIILGDVSGHGREALSRTTLIRYTLRAYLEAGLEPREVVKVGADALNGHFGNGFATVCVAIHDPGSGRFTYASAGHAPPIVVGPAAHEPVTVCSAPPIGIDEPTGFRQSTFTLTEGSTACLYTDGVTEAREGGRMLGRARIEQAMIALPQGADATQLLDRIAEIADEIIDDMAVCVVDAPAGAPADGPRIEELEVNEHEVGDSLEQFLRACGVALAEVPGILREAGEAARREGTATVRVRLNDFRPGVDVVPGNLVRLDERRRTARL